MTRAAIVCTLGAFTCAGLAVTFHNAGPLPHLLWAAACLGLWCAGYFTNAALT